MIDCFDGMVVSWSINTRPNAELVNTISDAAIWLAVYTSNGVMAVAWSATIVAITAFQRR